MLENDKKIAQRVRRIMTEKYRIGGSAKFGRFSICVDPLKNDLV